MTGGSSDPLLSFTFMDPLDPQDNVTQIRKEITMATCARGTGPHEMTPANTSPSGRCRKCRAKWEREHRDRVKEQIAELQELRAQHGSGVRERYAEDIRMNERTTV